MYAVLAALLVVAAPALEGPEAQIAAQMQADLPIDLAVVSVSIMGDATWSERAQLSVSWPRAPRAGTTMVPVTARDGGETRKLWAAVKLATLRPVLVTARSLAVGAVLEPSDLRVELQPVPMGEGLDLTADALRGQAVLRDLAEGEVVGRRDVVLPVPLPRGTTVTVVSKVGAARVEVQGTLATAARPGERARVRVPMTSRLLAGRLVSHEEFQLEVLP
ncbi:MAG: flagella basal body P-ring formation protein FlgA [Deltaproteobacteria bacterium]|nr:flagella basal body P-ring formation protein FlgA [Deltaproteobacteria bacterium]